MPPQRRWTFLVVPHGSDSPRSFSLSEKFVKRLAIGAGAVGLVAAIGFGYDLLAPWLVIAYVLFAAAMLTGLFGDRVFTLRLAALLATTPDGPVTPELEALFASTSHRAVTAFNYAWIPVLVFDMVVKPFS